MLEVLVEGDMKPAAAVWLLATIVFICEMVRQLQQMNDAAMSARMLPTPTLNDDASPAAAVLDTTAFPAATGRCLTDPPPLSAYFRPGGRHEFRCTDRRSAGHLPRYLVCIDAHARCRQVSVMEGLGVI
jgi:hypothetical protein